MYDQFENTAPVNEGEELDVRIIAIGDKGDGIAKKDGFVLVVPGTQVNDKVRIRVTKVLKRVGFAEVIGKPEKEEEAEEEEEEEEEEPIEFTEDFGEAEDTEDFGEE